MRVLFLDRDGTLIREPPDERVDSLEKLEILPGVLSGLRMLRSRGFELVMVSNQDGLGTEAFPKDAFERPHAEFLRRCETAGVVFREVFICPHSPGEGCGCRKPGTKLVTEFLGSHDVDLARSVMVGDRETDVMFGRAIGVRCIRISENAATSSSADIVVATFDDACRSIAAVRPDGDPPTDGATDDLSSPQDLSHTTVDE